MTNIIGDYLGKNLSILGLKKELSSLMKQYKTYTGRDLFVYAADFSKGKQADISLSQEDYFLFQDILRNSSEKTIDVYIETPGGSGEAAEEIARFLHKEFDEVNFVIAGEAKSAGTILALSGDNIYMNSTGSLGPIDAQVKIGRSMVSAYDYKTWVDDKREEAAQNGKLNPFDVIMVSQISPGEIYGVLNSLQFAIVLVKEWLPKYKFKNWVKTETRGLTVTEEMKKERAEAVTKKLCNHMEWHSHGRSLKIEDLSAELLIEDIDKDATLSDIVSRIKTVIFLIFSSSTDYKIYFWKDIQMARTANVNTSVIPPAFINPMPKKVITPANGVPAPLPPANADSAMIEIVCPKCGKKHVVTGYVGKTRSELDKQGVKKDARISGNDIFTCNNVGCNFAIDLKPIKNQIETQIKKIITF